MSLTATPVENPAITAAHAVFEAINSRRLERLDDWVTEDFVDHGSPVPVPPGPGGYRRVLGFVSQVLGLRYERLEEFATADRIVVRALAHGTSVVAVHGAEFAGRPYTMESVHIFRTRGTQLAEHWGVRDDLSVLQQIGALPPPPVPL